MDKSVIQTLLAPGSALKTAYMLPLFFIVEVVG